MFVNFSPYLIHTDYISIRYYSLMYLFGIICAYFILKKYYVNTGLKKEEIIDLITYCFLSGIIGARIFEVFIYNLQYYLNNPIKIFYIWEGGLSFHGGILGGVIGGFIFCYLHKNIDKWKLADLGMLAITPTIGFVRIGGNFINMELYGRETSVPWCIIFATDLYKLCRHPSQLYEGFFEGVILFFILYFVYKSYNSIKGLTTSVFIIMYSIFRFLLEFFREPDIQLGYFFGWITMGQILSVFMFFIGIFILVIVIKNNKLLKNNIKNI